MLLEIAPASCHARQSAGTPANVTSPASAHAVRKAAGNGDFTNNSGIPSSNNGKTKFENPYECASEIAARFGHSRRKPIVATMFVQSAASCSPVNVTNRAAPVVAEVRFTCAIFGAGNGKFGAASVSSNGQT